MESQVLICDSTLKRLLQHANDAQSGAWETLPPQQFMDKVLAHWQLMRPDALFTINYSTAMEPVLLEFDHRLQQTIINLLNNSADASEYAIDVEVCWDTTCLYIKISDLGNGVQSAISSQIGKPFITTKPEGLGLGLFLSHATMTYYHGNIRLIERKPKGTITNVSLPLKRQAILQS